MLFIVIQIISTVNHVQAIFCMGAKTPMKVFSQNDLLIVSIYRSVQERHITRMILLVRFDHGTMSVFQLMAVMWVSRLTYIQIT